MTFEKTGVALTLTMIVFRPSNAANTWVVDAPQATAFFAAPATPFDVVVTGPKAIATSTVTVAAFVTPDDNAWALQTSGWLSPGGAAQFRNRNAGNDTSISIGYKILTSAGATGNLTNRETANGGDAGRWLTETFAEVPGVVAKKWHPGFYMQLMPASLKQDQPTIFGYYDLIKDDTHVVGVTRRMTWAQLEGPTAGDYVAGIADIQAHINKLKGLAVPKRLIIRITDIDYDNLTGNSDYFPQYVRNSYLVQGNQSVGWCRWQAAAMDKYISMVRNIAAHFDAEPYFEGIWLLSETAFPLTGTPCSFSTSEQLNQIERLDAAAAAAFPRTNVLQSANFIAGGPTTMNSLMAYMNSIKVGLAGPDLLPSTCSSRPTPDSHITLQGLSGGHDYRDEMPVLHGSDADAYGGSLGNCSPDQVRDFFNDTLHGSHLFFPRNDFQGTPAQKWDTGILPYIDNSQNALTHTSCPAVYTQGCDTN